LSFFFLLALSNTNDVYARGVVLDCTLSEVNPEQPDDCPVVWATQVTFDFSNVDSGGLTLDFPLQIGDGSTTSLVLNRNGFLTFEPVEFDPSLTSLTNLGTNVIAPFYAPIDFTSSEVTIDIGQAYDLPADPDDPVIPFGPGVAYRVTWGALNGVSMLGGAADVTNRFQAIIIDRSDVAEGDFDLQLNYGPIAWESPPAAPEDTATSTLVGLVVGDTVVDFNRYYDSFLSNGQCEDPGLITTPGSFSLSEPFACNNITLEFRDGVGTMVGFTSDLALTETPSADRLNQAEEAELTLRVDNHGPDTATNANLVAEIPNGITVVDTQTDAGACTASGTQLTCELGEIATSAAATVTVTIRPESTGDFDLSSTVTADQLDPSPADDVSNAAIGVDPSADLSVASSLAATTVDVGDGTELALTVRNVGPSDASNVHLVVTLPAGTSVDSTANLDACTESESGLDCDLDALASGASTDLVIPVTSDDSGAFSLVATIAADEHDPDVDDNSAEAVLQASDPDSGGGGSIDPLALAALCAFASRMRKGSRQLRVHRKRSA
jgi:uncharacterized repeat protein (TIGR01451 family)